MEMISLKNCVALTVVTCMALLTGCAGTGKDTATRAVYLGVKDYGQEEVPKSLFTEGEPFSVTSQERNITENEERVILGNERFDEYLPLLEGKKVALFTNQTGIIGNLEDGEHILDALIEKDVDVTAVFCPEHGFRGNEDAGADIENSVDEKTGVPLLSLYASDGTHMPSEDDMGLFDILVIDMQDVGLRYYTYYISMYYLMDACAAYDKEVIVLDRPNPNGFYVDGPILQEAYKSGVGQLPVPVVYGMTWGELAQMINGEGWLKAGKDGCSLSVVPCENYTHHTLTSLICNPSPNIRTMRAVYLYSSLCFFENTLVSVGRGTDHPFESFGSPYLKGVKEYDYVFIPESTEGAANPQYEGEECYGLDLSNASLEEIRNGGINLNYLIDAYNEVTRQYPEENFWGKKNSKGYYWIDLLSGSDELRKMIEAGKPAAEIEASWQEDIDAFKTKRAPYLLYEE